MVDKLTTVGSSHASRRIGQLDAAQLLELERRIVVFLGLAR